MHARSDALRPLWSATAQPEGRLRAVPTPVADSEKQGLKTALSALRVAATRGAAEARETRGGDPGGAPRHDKTPGADALGALSRDLL